MSHEPTWVGLYRIRCYRCIKSFIGKIQPAPDLYRYYYIGAKTSRRITPLITITTKERYKLLVSPLGIRHSRLFG